MSVGLLKPKVSHSLAGVSVVSFDCPDDSDLAFLKDLERHKQRGVMSAFQYLIEDIQSNEKILSLIGEDKLKTVKNAFTRMELDYGLLSEIFSFKVKESINDGN